MSDKKYDAVTLAKALGIALMVAGHVLFPESVPQKVIYTFHMPLFFLMSGYCFKDKYLADPVRFIFRKLKGIYLPFIVFSLLFLALHNVFCSWNVYSPDWRYGTSDFLRIAVSMITRMGGNETMLGTFWFLNELLYGNLIFFFVLKLSNGRLGPGPISVILLVFAEILCITGWRIPYFNVTYVSMFAAFFIAVGYWWKKADWTFDKWWKWLLAPVAIGVELFLVDHIGFLELTPRSLPVYALPAILGSLFVFESIRKTECHLTGVFRSFPMYLGNHTLFVMALHFLSFKLVTFGYMKVHALPSEVLQDFPVNHTFAGGWGGILYFVAGIAIPLALAWVWSLVRDLLMKKKRNTSLIAPVILLAVLLVSCHKDDPVVPVTPKPSSENEFDPSADKVVFPEEFRAAWVATVYNVDWPKTSGASAQKAELIQLIRDIKSAGCNAVVFQVVSLADAMYKSSILPWSAALTDTQGKDPGFDPLQVAVETCHAEGLEIHGWFNPLRIGSTKAVRTADHPYKTHPGWWQEYKDSYYWNPGLPEVRAFLGQIMAEVMEKYDLDGTHIDDYFYPSGLKGSALTWNDDAQFAQYGGGKTRDKWREENINDVIRTYHQTVHQLKPSAVFGVSPAGRLELTRALYADPEQWIKQKTIDYLVPQIYWDHERNDDFADFDVVLPQWLAITGSVPLMPGLAAYKVLSSTEKTFYNNPAELKYQVDLCRLKSQICGNFWYNTTSLRSTTVLPYVKANVYPKPALTPRLVSMPEVLTPPVPTLEGKVIRWGESPSASDYVVLSLKRASKTSRNWNAEIVYSGPKREFTGTSGNSYIVLSRSGSARSSFAEVISIP